LPDTHKGYHYLLRPDTHKGYRYLLRPDTHKGYHYLLFVLCLGLDLV